LSSRRLAWADESRAAANCDERFEAAGATAQALNQPYQFFQITGGFLDIIKSTTASKHARPKMTLTWSHSVFATSLPVLDEKVIVLDEVGICSSVALANGRTTAGAAPKRRRNREKE
jgi:hypothetical protein